MFVFDVFFVQRSDSLFGVCRSRGWRRTASLLPLWRGWRQQVAQVYRRWCSLARKSKAGGSRSRSGGALLLGHNYQVSTSMDICKQDKGPMRACFQPDTAQASRLSTAKHLEELLHATRLLLWCGRGLLSPRGLDWSSALPGRLLLADAGSTGQIASAVGKLRSGTTLRRSEVSSSALPLEIRSLVAVLSAASTLESLTSARLALP